MKVNVAKRGEPAVEVSIINRGQSVERTKRPVSRCMLVHAIEAKEWEEERAVNELSTRFTFFPRSPRFASDI